MAGDLLDAARIEAGELELQLQDMDLREAARTIIDLYAPTSITHEVGLRAPDRAVIIRGDPLIEMKI